MPTNDPSAAPTDTPAAARDDATVAAVLRDADGQASGGGGLGGAAAADPLSGSGRTPAGTAPNAPIDAGVAADGDAQIEAAARTQAAAAGPAEPHPDSQ